VLRHFRAVGLERKALFRPRHEAPADAVRIPSGGAEGIRGHRGALAGPAVEDDRALPVELAGVGLEPVERDVSRARDVARLVLGRHADVHELGAGQLGRSLRGELVLGGLHVHGRGKVAGRRRPGFSR
jgi:hypothetical protein